MSRRIPLCFACLLVAVPAWAAPPDGAVPGAGGSTSIILRWNAPMPSGALIACRARVVPLGPGAMAQPAEASVVVPGGGAQCALEIPVTWQGSAPPSTITVIYELDARSATGTMTRAGVQTVVLPHSIERQAAANDS